VAGHSVRSLCRRGVDALGHPVVFLVRIAANIAKLPELLDKPPTNGTVRLAVGGLRRGGAGSLEGGGNQQDDRPVTTRPRPPGARKRLSVIMLAADVTVERKMAKRLGAFVAVSISPPKWSAGRMRAGSPLNDSAVAAGESAWPPRGVRASVGRISESLKQPK